MKVFNLYFKVLKKNIAQIFMYVGIFIGILIGVIIPNNVKTADTGYVSAKNDFAVFDYDNSKLSEALIDYLSNKHDLVVLKDDNLETIQDSLYADTVNSVVKIEEGFEYSFIKGDFNVLPNVYAIPNTVYEVLFNQDINSFLTVVNTYLEAGFDIDSSIEKAVDASSKEVEVEISDAAENEKPSGIHYFYVYLPWIFIAACVGSITTVLIALNKKGVKERIECSPYNFVRMNGETILGVVVTGFAICLIFIVASISFFTEDMLTLRGVLYAVNSISIMSVALAITYLISKITENPQIISLLSNILGLGMAFLCGVFVPMEFLSDTVIRIANFLPVYWNVRAIELIDHYSSNDFATLMSYLGIQLLFAAAICCVGLVIASRKRQSA